MFEGFDKVFPEPRKLVGIGVVVMVSCLLLLAAIYYDMGSTGGTYAALGCALFITAIFAPIPRWIETSLEVVAATGLIRGGVMLGLSPADTLFLTCALAFVVLLNWVDHNPPSEDRKKRKSIDTLEQKRVDQQVSTHHLTVDC